MICFIIRDMLSLRSSLVLARHHPSRSVHSDSVPSFRWMIFCRLRSSKREGNVHLLHSDVSFKWDWLIYFHFTSLNWTSTAGYPGNCQMWKEVHGRKGCYVFIEKPNTSDVPAQGERGEWTGYKQQALKSVSKTQLSECSTFPHLSHRAGRTSVGKGVRLLLGKCRWIPKRRKDGKD